MLVLVLALVLLPLDALLLEVGVLLLGVGMGQGLLVALVAGGEGVNVGGASSGEEC